jgi:hypothetical protein
VEISITVAMKQAAEDHRGSAFLQSYPPVIWRDSHEPQLIVRVVLIVRDGHVLDNVWKEEESGVQ